jgi:drug/metabolite transporter (DMT)-like permease
MKAMEVLSVTSFTTIRNAQPCVSAAVDFIVFRQTLNTTEICALVAITFGLAFFYRADVTYNYAGYLWTAAHMCSMTAYLCGVKIASERLKLGARFMSMYNNIGSLPLLVLMAVSLGETHAFQVASLSRSCVHVVSISCVGGFFISWTAMQAQKHVSITSFTILNTVSKLPAIMLSKLFFDGAITSGMVYGSVLTFLGCTVYSLSKQGFLKQTPLRVNYARGLYVILILWSVYLLYMSYILVRPMIASNKTFRHLKSKFSYFSKNRMQALSDLHFNISSPQNASALRFALKYNRTLSVRIIEAMSQMEVTIDTQKEIDEFYKNAMKGIVDDIQQQRADATATVLSVTRNGSSNTHAEKEQENDRNAVYYTVDGKLGIWRPEYLEKCTRNSLTIKRDHDIPGHDMGHLSVKLESCVQECWFNEQCQGFSYVSDGGTCWLKDTSLTFASYLPKTNVTSGFVDQSKRKKFLQRSLESWAALKCPPLTPPHSTSSLILAKLGALSRTNSRVNQTAIPETMEVRQGVSHVSGNESAVPSPKNTKALKYNRLLPTGFGDRISVYLSVAAAAATVGADVYVYWHDNPSDQRVCTVCRLAFESIRPFVQWPANLHVLREVDFEEETRHMDAIEFDKAGLLVSHHAFDGIYTTAWKTFGLPSMLPQLSRDAFELSYRKVALEMRIECQSHECQPVNMSKFIVLHFRGGDKMVPLSEFNTVEVLRRIPGHVPVVVVTDDDSRLNEMLSVAAPYGANITRLRQLPDELANRMRDFAVLLNATGIIQHAVNAWSSYSSVPAIMRGIPLLNTWIGHEEADIITNIRKSRRAVRNAQQSMKDAEEDHNNIERVNWKQKVSEEKENLRSLQQKHLEFQNASSVGMLRYFEEHGGCPVELRSSKRNEEISVFLNTVTLQMQGR